MTNSEFGFRHHLTLHMSKACHATRLHCRKPRQFASQLRSQGKPCLWQVKSSHGFHKSQQQPKPCFSDQVMVVTSQAMPCQIICLPNLVYQSIKTRQVKLRIHPLKRNKTALRIMSYQDSQDKSKQIKTNKGQIKTNKDKSRQIKTNRDWQKTLLIETRPDPTPVFHLPNETWWFDMVLYGLIWFYMI